MKGHNIEYKYRNSHERNINGTKGLLNSFFEKKFKFRKSKDWKIPEILTFNIENHQKHEFQSLQELKKRLNTVKSKLNDYQIESWSSHTRRRNPAGEIAYRIKNEIKAEFVTQAWCKFYECLNEYDLVQSSKCNSVHLCEAPGAFIAALNHYLHSKWPNSDQIKWQWLSTTMNPYHESNPLNNMVMDDRFMLHTLDKWLFGQDFTGNIMNSDNINDMARETAERIGSVDLITADGSIDCMETPESQEEVVTKLHFSEICAALKMLSNGGNFVLKMFTIFQATTVSLMYLLNCVFNEVNVYKPATSKCGNSEIYVICLGLERNTDNFDLCLNLMLSQLDKDNDITPIFYNSQIPPDYLLQHEVCSRIFMGYQITVIETNIHFYINPCASDVKQCRQLRQQVANTYIKRYDIHTISEEKKILYDRNATVQYEFHARIYSGSYTERLSINYMSTDEKIIVLRKQVDELKKNIKWSYEKDTKVLENLLNEIELKLYFGKPVKKIQSSLFINIQLMHLRSKIELITKNSLNCLESSMFCEITRFKNEKIIVLFETDVTKEDYAYGLFEKEFFKNILNSLSLNVKKIIFKNYTFLTHFAVSILKYLFGNIFNNLTINRNGTIILDNPKNKLSENCIIKIKKVLNDEENLICLVDIKELHKNEFSEAIEIFNNELFINKFIKILG